MSEASWWEVCKGSGTDKYQAPGKLLESSQSSRRRRKVRPASLIMSLHSHTSFHLWAPIICLFFLLIPAPYVKVYVMDGKRCLIKKKTRTARRTLEPLYQQQLEFKVEFTGKTLQVSEMSVSFLVFQGTILSFSLLTGNGVRSELRVKPYRCILRSINLVILTC